MKQRVFEPNYQAVLGLKQGHAITNMPFGSLLDVRNMNLDAVGGKSSRKGYGKLFELPTTDKIQSLLDYKKLDGTQKVMIYADDTIYNWDGSSVNSVITSLTPATPWSWCVFQDRVYGVNGTDSGFTYNGTSYTKISISAPAHVSLALVAGGSLAVGAFNYLITFYDSARGAESNPPDVATAPSATTAGANLTIRLSNFPTVAAGETVTHYRVYRRGPSETVYTRVAELDYATYVGNTYDDTGLTTGTIEIEYDTGQQDEGRTVHPQSKIVIEFSNRLFMVDETSPTTLVYSKQGEPHAFPSGNYFRIGEKDGARITKVEKHGESLIIHKRNSVYILEGDPDEFTPRRISGTGTQDVNTSVADADNYCYRLTPKGFYRFAPTEFSTTDLREEYIGTDISDDESQINWDATDEVSVFNYCRGGSRHIYFIFPAAADYSSDFLVFDQTTGQWVKYYVNAPVFATAKWEDDGQEKMIFGDDYGIVWEWDVGSSDGNDEEADVVNGTATSATSTTLTDSSQSWTVNQFKGCVLTIREGTGANQRVRIASNTATALTFVTALTTTPDTTSAYSIGAIDSYADEFWNSHNKSYQNLWKRMRWIVPYIRQSGDFDVEVSLRRDFQSGYDDTQNLELNVSDAESLWGSMIWGTDVWAGQTSNLNRLRFNGKYHYYSLRYRHRLAGNRFFWDGHGATFQLLYDRNK